MSAWPSATTPVLVAVVTHPRELARARDGWYRLPVARAPARVGCEVLAFYQTGAFGAEGHAVRYWATVLGVTPARRRELLPEEATHPRADDLYLRYALGPLTPLERPVPSRRLRRVTFIATTWGQLSRAPDVAALWPRAAPGSELGRALAAGRA